MCVFFFTVLSSCSGQDYPKNYFRSPLDIPLLLSGNFGELRSNHFHTGLDILTQGIEGKKIYAIADGYVSRINISPWGYGLVVYIDHPNGYTSVYAHLSAFSTKIDSAYTAAQRHMKKSILDFYPDANKIQVKKDEVIALSGNTGLSMGPHLHFEIRETKTEKPVNPLFFGFDIKDDKKPVLKGIRVYRFQHDSTAGYCDKSHVVAGGDGNYYMRDGSTVTISAAEDELLGIAIHAVDYLNGSNSTCGVYSIQLFIDNELIFRQETDKLDFNTYRYLNAHTDYDLFKQTSQSYHRSFLLANNKLEIYKHHNSRGLFRLQDNNAHQVKYIVEDVNGNTSTLTFNLKRVNGQALPVPSADIMLNPNTENHIDKKNFQLFLPPGTVYHMMPFQYSSAIGPSISYSPLIKILTESIPVQQYYTLKIESKVPSRYKDKCVMVQLKNGAVNGKSKATWLDGWVSAEWRTFGDFTVYVDTIAPVIQPLNISENKNIRSNTEISFSINDNLSGIEDFALSIDDEWIPLQFNPKKNKYFVLMKSLSLSAGNHTVKFTATDRCNNSSSWNCKFQY